MGQAALDRLRVGALCHVLAGLFSRRIGQMIEIGGREWQIGGPCLVDRELEVAVLWAPVVQRMSPSEARELETAVRAVPETAEEVLPIADYIRQTDVVQR